MVASIYYLIPVPQIGLKGYLLGFVISSLIGFILNLRALNRRVNIIEFAGSWFFMPLIPSAVFGLVLFLIYSASSSYIREEIVRICLALFTGLPVYLVFAVRYRILKIEDIRRIMNIRIWFNQLF
jgi:stage V sporulation protein B